MKSANNCELYDDQNGPKLSVVVLNDWATFVMHVRMRLCFCFPLPGAFFLHAQVSYIQTVFMLVMVSDGILVSSSISRYLVGC